MDNSRFNGKFDDFEIYGSNGTCMNDQLEQLKNNGELIYQVGDKVKLNGSDKVYLIRCLNYEIPGLGHVDYAASLLDDNGNINSSGGSLYYFNQNNIECIVDMQRGRR